jgi:predicted dehydrogenase
LWANERAEGEDDVHWQLRNWLYFTYLSGDHIVEQHIHNVDVINWAKNGHPVKATALAGRQVRTLPVNGHIFDHFAVEYEFADGSYNHSFCRQIDGCVNRVSESIIGTKGKSNCSDTISGETNWKYDGAKPNPYVQEHADLIKAITSGEKLNEAQRVAESTLTVIMGRMSAYTGQQVTWEEALNSQEVLMSDDLAFGDKPVPSVAVPGQTKLV